VVVKVHGSDVLLLQRYPARIRKTIEALRKADGIIAVSQDLACRIHKMGVRAAPVDVIHDGVEINLFHPGPMLQARQSLGLESDGSIILFVGNLVPVKGIDVLIAACARMHRAGLAFSCNLIGEGPLRATLDRQIRQLGLENSVHLLGSKPHAELPDWYRAATVVALASHSEGVPNVLLEAAASGTPFVASRVGGIPEIAHLGASRLVPAGDMAALADALTEFLTGPRSPRPVPAIRNAKATAEDMIVAFDHARRRYACGNSVALCAM
jgi:glycosyltransferase involved in cell wall biosynthesis